MRADTTGSGTLACGQISAILHEVDPNKEGKG